MGVIPEVFTSNKIDTWNLLSFLDLFFNSPIGPVLRFRFLVSFLLKHLANAPKTNAEENIESLYPFTADAEK